MELKAIVFICSLFCCDEIVAQEPTWILQPNICVAKEVGDECQLSLTIKTENMPAELFCLFIDGQLLNCSRQAYFPREIAILIKQDTLLELKNKAQQTILSKTLLIKYIEPFEQRRRIRPPWSLF